MYRIVNSAGHLMKRGYPTAEQAEMDAREMMISLGNMQEPFCQIVKVVKKLSFSSQPLIEGKEIPEI